MTLVTATVATGATFQWCCTLYAAGDTVANIPQYLRDQYQAVGVFT